MILDIFPSIEEFYKSYWGQKPFMVKGAISAELFNHLIDPDHLAGLALEEDIKSRIVIKPETGHDWLCEHGPFEEDRFSTLGEENWSLLVQNVEQYHSDTAALLDHFDFSPRWLMDDIMVSYSTSGGGVGPHIDSYHVFLVQGMGRRIWTVGKAPATNHEYIEGLDLKVLKEDFEGEDFDVSIGDVIYIPPNYAHKGETLEEALTFSVGFLGPKMSELLIEYGYYLEEQEIHNHRYSGKGLDGKSAGASMADAAKQDIQSKLLDTIRLDGFSDWLDEYFSKDTLDH